MKPREFYDKLIADLPVGSERTVLRVLSFHVGLTHAISKGEFLIQCSLHGSTFRDERQLRATIVALRKQEVPICSSSGEGGYYLPETFEEYQEFLNREYVKKFNDMRETAQAMNHGAQAMFPKVTFGTDIVSQASLF